MLIDALNENFGFKCTIFTRNVDQYRIYINQKDMPILISKVAPHMHPGMFSKLGKKKVFKYT